MGNAQKSNSLPSESPKPPESEFWKPVEKFSLWTSSLNKLHWDKTLSCSKDHETPEKPSNTEVLQASQKHPLAVEPSHTFDPKAGNSNELEVDEPPEVTRSKHVQFIRNVFISVKKVCIFCWILT